jgi:hypothetical protein
MAAWDRDMPWRQGHALTSESGVSLGVLRAEDVGTAIAIVISHDCDLTQTPEAEPLVEVIVGRRVAALDGNFTHAKLQHVRRRRRPRRPLPEHSGIGASFPAQGGSGSNCSAANRFQTRP